MSRPLFNGATSEASSLSVILSALPSLPRPVLGRLTARMIERMDELDGDPDLEPEPTEDDTEDCCTAHDDRSSGATVAPDPNQPLIAPRR